MAQPITAQSVKGPRAFLTWLRRRLHLTPRPWCRGTGTEVSTGATEHGETQCPICLKDVGTVPGPRGRYRIIGEHT